MAQRMPVALFGHGTPMNALDRNRYTEASEASRMTLYIKLKSGLKVAVERETGDSRGRTTPRGGVTVTYRLAV